MTTRVVNRYAEGFDVYIGRLPRGFHYGNPFTHRSGKSMGHAEVLVDTREEAVAAYRDWLLGDKHKDVDPERRMWILQNMDALMGKRLGCFCKPKACHGDVLIEMMGGDSMGDIQQTLSLDAPPEIKFNSREDGPYKVFSNMWPVDIADVNGDLWPSSEHMYQASKCRRHIDMMEIRACDNAFQAKRRGRGVTMRSDWADTKLDVMRRIQFRKYSQNQFVRDVLLGTGDAVLIEHAPWDNYWGDGGDGSGENWMGRILMDLRTELRKQVQ